MRNSLGTWAETALIELAGLIVRIWRRLYRWSQPQSVLILPPARPGSLGDEAMVTATVTYLEHTTGLRVGLASFSPDAPWHKPTPGTRLVEISGLSSRLGLIQFLLALPNYDRFYCLGADVLDGFYSEDRSCRRLRWVDAAARAGAETRILGFSINSQPANQTLRCWRALHPAVRLSARDPETRERLSRALNREVGLAADTAFLLRPTQSSPFLNATLAWIGAQRHEGRLVMAVNINSVAFERESRLPDEKAFAQRIVEALEDCSLATPLSILFVPHDQRATQKDGYWARAVFMALPEALRQASRIAAPPFSAADVKAICAHVDMAFTGRMHLAIACLAQGTPPAAITYQGKFRGLYGYFGLEALLLEPAQALEPGRVSQLLRHTLSDRVALRQRILDSAPRVLALAKANFD